MRRKSHKPYFLLFLFLLFLISLPQSSTEKIQGLTFATFAPMWQTIAAVPMIPQTTSEGEALSRLELENQMLKKEMKRLQEMVQHHREVLSQVNQFKKTEASKLSKRDVEHFKELLNLQVLSIPASVIFRSATSWSSSLWINVGEANNRKIGSTVVAKNSPVVVGKSVVGVIDYVGEHQSRVRLITDSGLNPSVRVARTGLEGIAYLAKGELHGSSSPLWRSRGQHLHGIGFNYDFADEEGPARDLHSGIPVKESDESLAIPILKVKDLLVTTGMDGVFPMGLHVAEVMHVYPLREGDYFYEIEAVPTAGNLNDLTVVYVMPPLGYDVEDLPSPLGE